MFAWCFACFLACLIGVVCFLRVFRVFACLAVCSDVCLVVPFACVWLCVRRFRFCAACLFVCVGSCVVDCVVCVFSCVCLLFVCLFV